MNDYIRAREVRIVDEKGMQLGVMPPFEALEIARGRELDLVEVSPLTNPPVCRIMDYGKFQYQQSKLERENKAKQKKIEVKGIRLGIRTDAHDREFKRNQADKFLAKGDKVKVEILLKGREKAHQDLARTNLSNFIKTIATPHKIEQEIKRFPGGFNIIVAPL